MSKEDVIEAEGVVVEVLGNMNFKVEIMNSHVILAYVSGKLRANKISKCLINLSSLIIINRG